MRKFLPALRGSALFQNGAVEAPDVDTDPVYMSESKSLSLGGGVGATYSSTTTYGQTIYGTEGRADYWNMDAVITQGYERVVWVYRCIELISGHGSRLPFRAARNRGTDFEEVLEHHSLYRVLNKKSNPMEKSRHFRKRLIAQLLLSKRGVFVEKTRSRAGTIVRLDLLDPSRCRPIPDPHGDYILHFEYVRRDGRVREIPVENVLWIREPHPTDPFSGTTPLEAAGLSVELDFLSRLYNSSFIKNDSRPGGVLGVDSDSLTDQEMDRLERKFKPGVQNAGELTVIGTGAGGMNYVDTTTKPRDMAYESASRNAKTEILGAFGLGESLLGNASERSFENADAELYNFWTQVMPPILELIADAFDEEFPDGWEPFFDTSGIEVLEIPRRRDREEARTEWAQGLRSVNEYRVLCGLPPLDNAQARALWVSPSKAPIPGNPEDAAELGMAGGDMGALPPEGGPPGGGVPPEAGPDGGAPPGDAAAAVAAAQDGSDATETPLTDPSAPADAVSGAESADAAAVEGQPAPDEWALTPEDMQAAEQAPGDAAAAVADAQADTLSEPIEGDATAAVADAQADALSEPVEGDAADAIERARRGLEGKALLDDTGTGSVVIEPDPNATASLWMAVTAALEALFARQQGVITARLESPKARKGTKFWTPDNAEDTRGGEDPLDAEKIVNAERWEQQVTETVTPLIEQAATRSAEDMLAQLAAAGLIVGGAVTAEEISKAAAQVAAAPAKLAIVAAASAAAELLSEITDTIRNVSHGTNLVHDVTAAVRDKYARAGRDAAEVAAKLSAAAAIEGARDATARALLPVGVSPTGHLPTTPIVREWITVGDGKVRPAHAAANGQLRLLDEPFDLLGFEVRFPGDPLAPGSLRYGCRCHLRYRVDASARLIAPPV